MNPRVYSLGKHLALTKLGMPLSFDNEEEANRHYHRRKAISKIIGAMGNVAGGVGGAVAGGAVGGMPGTLGGAYLGSELGQRAFSAPAVTLYDAMHDMPQRATSQYRSSMARMNAGAGMPTGVVYG